MEKTLGYIIFGFGWPVLIIGSIWAWRKIATLSGQSKTFLNVSLLTFYVLGYTCTMYWFGQPWQVGVLPAFAAFLVLFIISIRGVVNRSQSLK